MWTQIWVDFIILLNIKFHLGITLSSLFIVVLCFLMEGIRWYRLYRKKEQWSAVQYQTIPTLFIKRQIFINLKKKIKLKKFFYKFRINANILIDGILHAIQITISYALMLIFMVFFFKLYWYTNLSRVLTCGYV